MVVGEPSIHNIMGGMESTGGVRLHNHKRKLKQRFDIIKKLGQGTYGKVQLGINKETGQEVAIKTIKKCKIETEADLIRIRREIQIMSSVQHPNIIHIYEVFENREKMVLVMEYAAGGELYDYLSERKVLTEEEARRIFRQITIAVFYCHKHKICHRDLKLENILLDQTGNAKIADFGLSNVFDNRRLLNTFCGSPLYASPEIVKGTPYHGPEVDCWSLGVLLYTLVYGAMPFDGSNFKRLTRQISASDYFEPKIPSTASPLIKDMLTKCPIKRADIEKICSHWWVNQGYEDNCLNIAENLAAQTPVRLDLLLSLVPQSASADKLVVGDAQENEKELSDITAAVSEVLPPTRCHSVGSLMELDRNNTDKIREMIEEEKPIVVDTKRKLETTPSMEETVCVGSKKKERSRKVDKPDERERRVYVSNSRHHSAPIATTIKEEQMEVDPYEAGYNDLNSIIKEALALQFIKEEEKSKTPIEVSKNKVDEIVDKKDDEELISPEILPETLTKKSPKTKKPSSPKKFQVSEVKTESNVVESISKKETSPLESVKNDKIEEKLNKPEENLIKNEEKPLVKKLRQKAMSMDSDDAAAPSKPVERRRSKIFETAEKFNQLAAATEIEKPKKIFIPGVNVDGAKRVFERKASLGSALPPSPPVKQSASKIIIDVSRDKKQENDDNSNLKNDEKKKEEDKKRAVDIITGALGKPPVVKKSNGSPPVTPQSQDPKKLDLKIQLASNDVRNATVSISTPTETKYPELETTIPSKPIAIGSSVPTSPEINESPTMSSKMEITLKSATLPRRKTSKAEITLAGYKPTHPFKSEIEAKIQAFQPSKLRTQRSEVAFPVAASYDKQNRSSSLGPENPQKIVKERIIPIQVENDNNNGVYLQNNKPPMTQRSLSQKSESLSRQSTADSDNSDNSSAVGSVNGPEAIKKSPREYIIPIAVEGGGYVTPRSSSLEPECKTGGGGAATTGTRTTRNTFGRSRRIGSLLSDASEDELPFSSLHRDSDDILQRHMHRLRSSRPSRQSLEHADSLSSGEEEDDDDDGFELLTAENLFSTLLSRVRSLTQRLNVDDTRGGSGFPSSRLLGRLGSNSTSQGFWGAHEPLSRRTAESPFRRPLSRDMDRFGRKDSAMSSTPGTPSSIGGRSERNPSRDSVFDVGSSSSSTLPRDEHCEEEEEEISSSAKDPDVNGPIKLRSSLSRDASRENLTPCLARRLSRQFIEQTRQSLPRSPSIPRERLYRSSTEEPTSIIEKPEYRSRSSDRTFIRDLRRTNSLLDSQLSSEKYDSRSSRRSISLFDDNDDDLPPLPRQIMTLGRKYRDPIIKSPPTTTTTTTTNNGIRRDMNLLYAEKIQEESSANDDQNSPKKYHDNLDNTELNKQSSTTNINDVTPSLSIKSFDTSPAESSSNIQTDSMNSLKADTKEFESRLIAAENLIKESKLRNFGVGNYNDNNKCDNELLTKNRRSCIPSLRLRSESLNRDSPSWSIDDRRKTLACSHDSSPERSLLSKLFRSSSSSRSSDTREKSPKATRRRISRFLRPDFFDTPREESQYVKDKEAQKAAENERRKIRFMRRKCDNVNVINDENKIVDDNEIKPEKEFKNKVNEMTRDKVDNLDKDDKKIDDVTVKNTFFQNLEKKFDKLMGGEENSGLGGGEEKSEIIENSCADVVQETIIVDEKSSKEEASVCDLIENEAPTTSSTTKSKVSSVLGLFKNDSKSTINGTKPTSTLLSKFKKNTYKGSRSDTSVVVTGESSSKIPTKSKNEIKNELKITKKIVEKKQSPEKITEVKKSMDKILESKKLPSQDIKIKEKTPPIRLGIERKLSVEKPQNKLSKKTSPEKLIKGKIDTKDTRKLTPEKSDNKLSFVSRLSPKKSSPEKVLDNKKIEAKGSKDDNEEKKNILKKKKYVKSLTSLARNGSLSKVEKEEDKEKKLKKIVKKDAGDSEGKDENDDGKKKKIIKVVKKVVKKSSSYSDGNKLDKGKDSEKIGKLLMKKVKKENSPEVLLGKKEKSPKIIEEKKEKSPVSEKLTKIPASSSSSTENGLKEDSTDLENTRIRANRSNLKLDLTKIYQHSFKAPVEMKSKPELNPKDDDKEDSSKIINHGNIGGHKIVIDKSLKAEELAHEEKAPVESNTCLNLRVNLLNSSKTPSDSPRTSLILPERCPDSQILPEIADNLKPNKNHEINPEIEEKKLNVTMLMKPKITETTEDILSPMEDNESFDSWSICSNDYNNRIGSDLQSPTSPGYSPSSRGDNPESIIDRIRRKSFYSRFNERKHKNSLNIPPTTPSGSSLSSSTLPRKFSFNNSNSSKEINDIKRRSKPLINSYSSNSLSNRRNNSEKTFSMYSDDLPSYRRSPQERERYSDICCSLGPSSDLYKTSCYDPLRRYRVSPLPDSSSRGKYSSSSDFNYDCDIGNYKSSSLGLGRDSNTLPRKYRGDSLSRTASIEPKKTADYYEELLSPSRLDYLTSKNKTTSPVPPGDCKENGYHNGDGQDKWKNSGGDSGEESDSRGDDLRSNSQPVNESKELSAACPDSDDVTTIE